MSWEGAEEGRPFLSLAAQAWVFNLELLRPLTSAGQGCAGIHRVCTSSEQRRAKEPQNGTLNPLESKAVCTKITK